MISPLPDNDDCYVDNDDCYADMDFCYVDNDDCFLLRIQECYVDVEDYSITRMLTLIVFLLQLLLR